MGNQPDVSTEARAGEASQDEAGGRPSGPGCAHSGVGATQGALALRPRLHPLPIIQNASQSASGCGLEPLGCCDPPTSGVPERVHPEANPKPGWKASPAPQDIWEWRSWKTETSQSTKELTGVPLCLSEAGGRPARDSWNDSELCP